MPKWLLAPPPPPNPMERGMKIWSCKIGECDAALLADGADAPMREAVQRAYREVTGLNNAFCFSGWGAELDEPERAVVEKREPSEEYYRNWLMREAAPALYEALKGMLETSDGFDFDQLCKRHDATVVNRIMRARNVLAKCCTPQDTQP